MLSWDTLMMGSQALALIATLPTVFDVRAYVPRRTSVMIAVAMTGVTTACLGLGAPLGALIAGLVVCAWVFICVRRGRPLR